MKEVIPVKLIVEYDKDGNYRTALLQYKMRIDGAVDERKFYTMTVDAAISAVDINNVLKQSKDHIEKGEKIKE